MWGRRAILLILLLGVSAFTLGPFVWMLSSSLKTNAEILAPGGSGLIPRSPTLANYRFLFENVPFGTYLANTVFLAGASAVLATMISAMGGYALAKYEFRGRQVVSAMILGTMVLPPVVLLAPLFKVTQALGLIDSFWGIILPTTASGFGVLIMRQYLRSVPEAVIDAGRLDGASEFRIFWTLVLPLVRPILSALTIFTFLGAWNAYLWPLIVIRSEDKYPLTVAVTNVVASIYQQEYGVVLAGTLISIAPILVLFLVLQREFISGLTLGAVKQ